VIIIYAVVNDYLNSIPVKKVQDFERDLFEYMDTTHPDIITSITTTKDLTKENEESLKGALTEFVKKYLNGLE
jgi:F-type H+-transporting ATPase subunit alpha